MKKYTVIGCHWASPNRISVHNVTAASVEDAVLEGHRAEIQQDIDENGPDDADYSQVPTLEAMRADEKLTVLVGVTVLEGWAGKLLLFKDATSGETTYRAPEEEEAQAVQARCVFVAADVQSKAEELSLTLTDQQAEDFLARNRRQIQDDMSQRGYDSIETLLELEIG